MSIITGDDEDNEVKRPATTPTCEDRGDGLNPRHVYLDGSGKCQCGGGPKLSERRME